MASLNLEMKENYENKLNRKRTVFLNDKDSVRLLPKTQPAPKNRSRIPASSIFKAPLNKFQEKNKSVLGKRLREDDDERLKKEIQEEDDARKLRIEKMRKLLESKKQKKNPVPEQQEYKWLKSCPKNSR